jgi:hypothetical protein
MLSNGLFPKSYRAGIFIAVDNSTDKYIIVVLINQRKSEKMGPPHLHSGRSFLASGFAGIIKPPRLQV